MDKRLITKRQEQALRLCHQNLEGLSQIEAAKRMNISQSALSNLLTRVKKVLPSYFPILTKLEAKVYHWYMIEGWSAAEIAEHIERCVSTIYKALQRAKDKGMYFTKAKGRILSYDKSMDANVKQKF